MAKTKTYTEIDKVARARFRPESCYAFPDELMAMEMEPEASTNLVTKAKPLTLVRDAVGMEREAALCALRGDDHVAARYRRCAAALRYVAKLSLPE